jgi:hypothetical protein
VSPVFKASWPDNIRAARLQHLGNIGYANQISAGGRFAEGEADDHFRVSSSQNNAACSENRDDKGTAPSLRPLSPKNRLSFALRHPEVSVDVALHATEIADFVAGALAV